MPQLFKIPGSVSSCVHCAVVGLWAVLFTLLVVFQDVVVEVKCFLRTLTARLSPNVLLLRGKGNVRIQNF